MNTLKIHYGWSTIIVLFFCVIFALSIVPFEYDVWFHFKSGEIFSQRGIIYHDVFSYTAQGRHWYPYEWLFQVTIFWVKELFGLSAIKVVVAAISTLLIIVLYALLRKIYSLTHLVSIVLSFALFASIYEFISARPQLVAHVLFLVYLYILLQFIEKNRGILWLTIPLILVWANIHSTVIYAVYLSASYAAVSFIAYMRTQKRQWLRKAIVLGAHTGLMFVLTLLPPIGTTQYQILWLFWQKQKLITNFIDEWRPLSTFGLDLLPYLVTIVIITGLTAIALVRKKNWRDGIMILPLVPFLLAPLVSVRNLFIAYIAITCISGWALMHLSYQRQRLRRWLLYGVGISVVIAGIALLVMKRNSRIVSFPDQAVQFLKNHQIEGNMYNGIGPGGYLLYHLYPQYKVFYDGRADVYLCCEIADVVALLAVKNEPTQFRKHLETFINKYAISFVILETRPNTIQRLIAQLLGDDPMWRLVFWTDTYQILVKNDGKNDGIIREFGVAAADPLELTPYQLGKESEARFEYQRMISIADSALSRNALAYLYMRETRYEEARRELEQAIAINPDFDSPYMNLGELAAHDGNYKEAIRLYQKALSLGPDRGFTYIRLGQMYIEGFDDTIRAQIIWQRGLSAPISTDSKEKLEVLLSTLTPKTQ